MKRSLFAACLLPLLSLSPSLGNEAFFFRDGDRVAFVGDSITEARQATSMIETYLLSRFPQWKITFRHVGWSGDSMGLRRRGGVEAGYQRDIAPLKATVATICFGMNDARGGNRGESLETYLASAAKLADLFAADHTRIAFISSSPEEASKEGEPAGSNYNHALRKYTDALSTVAKEKGAPLVDQLAPMIALIEQGRRHGVLRGTDGGPRFAPDKVHPEASGGLAAAATILKALNAPALVSRVTLDAATKKANAEQATVSELSIADNGIEFTRLDQALPWPIRANFELIPRLNARLALTIPEFRALFDQLSLYELKATNLPAPKYQVSIDGKPIGTFTREALASGINLSVEAAQVMEEVQLLLEAVDRKNALFHTQWREVGLMHFPAWLPNEMVEAARAKEIERLEGALIKAEQEPEPLRQPKPHRWRLTPVS